MDSSDQSFDTDAQKSPQQELHLFFLVDNSASMSGENRERLNDKIKSIVATYKIVLSNPNSPSVFIRVIQYSEGASWFLGPGPIPIECFVWHSPEPGTSADAHAAIRLLIDAIASIALNGKCLPPICILLSSATSSDPQAFYDAVNELNAVELGRIALRLSYAIGSCSTEELLAFCGDPSRLYKDQSLLGNKSSGSLLEQALSGSKKSIHVYPKSSSEQHVLSSVVRENRRVADLSRVHSVTDGYPATERGTFLESDGLDAVDCTLFSPVEAQLNDDVLIQIYIHDVSQSATLQDVAKSADCDTVVRAATSLGTKLAKGTQISFNLSFPSLSRELPVKAVTWNGRTQRVTFLLTGDSVSSQRVVVGLLVVSTDSVPIGEIAFNLRFTNDKQKYPPLTSGTARRYQKAFVSYASENRQEVLARVQMLSAAGIQYFQDVIDLEPGDRWAKKLYLKIDESDVMFLFWSTPAKESEWVEREWRYGLKQKGDEYIRPVIIEGPPIPQPPEELKHLHFNDKVRYFIKAME